MKKIKCSGCGEIQSGNNDLNGYCKKHLAEVLETDLPQSQQGIIDPEKGGIINWAAVRDLLDVQRGITRKETLEEVIEII